MKILIIENSEIIIDALKNIFKERYTVKSVFDIKDAAKVNDFQPDVVFLGETTVDERGAIKCVKDMFSNSKVVLIYEHEDSKEGILRNIIAGADGYIPSKWGVEKIENAMKYLLKEGVLLPHEIICLLVKEIRKLSFGWAEMTEEYGLTDRDKKILKFLSQGKTNKEIAVTLNVSEKTVKNNSCNIYKKLKVRNHKEAIAKFCSFFVVKK
ncbi:MAG: response regulator transcription factor [Candidatus Firestonebacteria bacterium]